MNGRCTSWLIPQVKEKSKRNWRQAMETKPCFGPNYFTHLYEGFTRFLTHYLQLPNNKLTSLRLFDAFFVVKKKVKIILKMFSENEIRIEWKMKLYVTEIHSLRADKNS